MDDVIAVLYGSEYMGMKEFVGEIDGNHSLFLATSTCVWEDFLDHIKTLKKTMKGMKGDNVDYGTHVIDKVNHLYTACVEHICEEEEVEDPSMAGTKKPLIWKKVKQAMTEALYDFAALPGDKIFIADEKMIELNSTLFEGTFFCPKFEWVLTDIMPDIVTQTLYFTTVYKTKKNNKGKKIRREEQIIICQPRPDVFAGDHEDRLPRHLKGKNVKEMYKNYERFMTNGEEKE